MAKRYYLCDIKSRSFDGDPNIVEYYAAIDDYKETGFSYATEIQTDVNGVPVNTWALAIVATKNHARLNGKADIDQLPDFPLDGKVSSINTVARGVMKNALTRRGIAVAVDNTDGYRDLLQSIGRLMNPKFNVDNFDTGDV